MNNPTQEKQRVVVRKLVAEDLGAVVALDAVITGRRREQYFQQKLEQAMRDTGVQLSLAAEAEDRFVGFLLARVYYGEFGRPEPVAVLDTLGVDTSMRSRGVGRALLGQLQTNLHGLGVRTLQTEVSLDAMELAFFFHHVGFRPASRLCLDLDLQTAPRMETAASE